MVNGFKQNIVSYFLSKNKNNSFKDAIISNVENTNCAINCNSRCGPYFGYISPNESTDYGTILYKKKVLLKKDNRY